MRDTALEQERLEQKAVNEERVAFREDAFADKLEAARRRREEEAAQEAEREARLQAIAMQVPYRAAVDEIVPDPARTRSHTFTSQTAAELGVCHAEFLAGGGDVRALVGSGDKSDLAQHRLHERGFFMADGFTSNQMFSNLQFKMGVALREAGLHNSEYARQVMSGMAATGSGHRTTHVLG